MGCVVLHTISYAQGKYFKNSLENLTKYGLSRGAIFTLSECYIRCHSEHPIWVRPHEGRQALREMRSETGTYRRSMGSRKKTSLILM